MTSEIFLILPQILGNYPQQILLCLKYFFSTLLGALGHMTPQKFFLPSARSSTLKYSQDMFLILPTFLGNFLRQFLLYLKYFLENFLTPPREITHKLALLLSLSASGSSLSFTQITSSNNQTTQGMPIQRPL
jgi:hypothetical protein